MNEIKIFENPEFGKVRTAEINNETMFCLLDVCKALDIFNVSECKRRLQKDWVSSAEVIDDLGRKRFATFINESNLYRVIFQSRKPSAVKFTDWVTTEVLPSIRKTGQYSIVKDLSNIPNFRNPAEAARAWADQYDRADKAEEILSKEKPKIEFYNAVAGSKDAVEMSAVAKMLDKKIGRNNLFQFLREKKILRDNNEPYQEYIDRGWFRVIEQKYTTPEGETKINIKPLVYQKGIEKINRMLEA